MPVRSPMLLAAGMVLMALGGNVAAQTGPTRSGPGAGYNQPGGMGERALPGGPPPADLNQRLNLPGSRANPPVRGTDLDRPPCPQKNPNSNPTMRR